jgi:hypothetical protein
MLTDFPTSDVHRWITNFDSNDTMPFASASALISLQDLEAFVAKIKGQQADSVRVYFMRFQSNDTPRILDVPGGPLPKGCKWNVVSGDLSQGAIAMVPAKNLAIDDNDFLFTAEDVTSNGMITVLMPGLSGKGTGMNPPSPAPKTLGGH